MRQYDTLSAIVRKCVEIYAKDAWFFRVGITSIYGLQSWYMDSSRVLFSTIFCSLANMLERRVLVDWYTKLSTKAKSLESGLHVVSYDHIGISNEYTKHLL